MLRTGMGIALAIVLMMALLAETAWAGEFSSRLGVGVLVMDQADNLSGRGNRIAFQNERPPGVSRLLPIGLLDLRYTWDRHQLSFGSAVDDPAGLTLGYRRKLAAGALSSSLFYSFFGREWRNPYLFGVPRSDTAVHTFGGRVSWEEIGGTPLTLTVKGSLKRVQHEELGGDLRRDGGLLDLDLGYRRKLDEEWTLTPFLSYQRGEYEGRANNFSGAGFGLALGWHRGDLQVSTRLGGTLTRHDRVHPVFGQRRQDLGYRFSTLLTWGQPLGLQHWFASAGLIRHQADSTITFFDSSATYGFALMGYQF